MKQAPAFQLYAQDFLVGTADMSAEEVGGYIRLLCYQWAKGSLPNDPEKLKNLSGCTSDACASIMLKFRICEDGALRNERLEEVRAEQLSYRQSRSEKCPERVEKEGYAEHVQCMCITGADAYIMLFIFTFIF
ncbi:MAG: YdaU family protein [Opitutus sp.]|nr:YdaU family protein [Opitutus sp.]